MINPGSIEYFIVPSGKNLYFDDITQSGVSCQIYSDGILLDFGSASILEDLILKEGDSVLFPSTSSNQGLVTAYGYLVDIDSNIEIVNIILDINSPTYTVPANKKIIIENCLADGTEDITVTLSNTQSFTSHTNMPENVAYLSPGTIIQANPNPNPNAPPMHYLMTGYLIND